MDIKWPAYPFGKSVDRNEFYAFVREGKKPGAFVLGLRKRYPSLANLANVRTGYYPTDDEISQLGESPNWDRLRAKLLAQGHSIDSIREMTPIDVSVLIAGEKATDSGQQNGQSKKNVPNNPKVLKLANKILLNRDEAKSNTDIAREMTDDENEAQSLLRQLRRFPHLLE